ncbi:hypothetical protein LPTSP4_16690 [Leptospira ryugenii]|uniref:Uncharacterized protein n=1 Tax=Leptospira ryugenii TaxID=1917863 RepID=A0A2P2DZU0_9LEPT|nr:hypothetical protein [Leptospira ryugenii]GBF50145.1 hypothetical protein LPTSP4_16690 [Leptospira ryugenii]
MLFTPLAAPSEPWTILVDILFFFLASAACAYYFYYYKRRDLLGKFWGSTLVAGIGALIVFATLQTYIRDIIMWLMSPKIGSTQLSNVNLVAIFLGGFIALYIMNRINHNKERRD